MIFTFNQFKDLFANASTGQIIGMCIGGLVIAVILFFIGKDCYKFDETSGKDSKTIPKIIISATISTAFTLFGKMGNLSDIQWVLYVIFAVFALIILIWNFKSVGFIRGFLYTLFDCTLGTIAGWIIGGILIKLIPIAIVIGILWWFIGGKIKPKNNTEVPEYLKNTQNNASYRVETGANGNDTIYIVDENGDRKIVRKSDQEGRYIDDDGNDYI